MGWLWLWLGSVALGGGAERLLAWAADEPAPEPVPAVAAGYRFTGPLFRELGAAAAPKPGAVRVEVIGRTMEDRPIWAFHVSEPGVEVRERVLVFGGIHALEWIGVEAAADLLLELIALPPRGIEVTVVPLLNPDGRARVQADLRAGQNVYRRGNHVGVDLNRNFAVHRDARSFWRRLLPGYHAASGTGALSEPEAAALDALLSRHAYARAASLHAFGGYHFFPWSGRWAHTDDHRAFVRLGRAMEAAQGAGAYRPRQLGRWGFFFRAQGTEIDHMYGEYGTLAFLIEVTRSGAAAFPPGAGWRVFFRRYNPANPRPHRARTVAALRVLVRGGAPGP